MSPSNSIPTLAVTGHGRVRATPDRIVFALELDALTSTVDETYRRLDDLRGRVSAALASVDVESRRVRSSGPQVSPHYEYEEKRWVFKGIHGSERITVRIPFERGRATEVVRALGGELDHVRASISHLARDTSAARAEALRAAVADACTQAEIIADASGMALGSICELKHGPRSSDRNVAFETIREAAAGEAHELDPADILVETEIDAVWTLVKKDETT